MCGNFDSLGHSLVSFLEYHILFLQMDTKCQICTSPFVQNTLNIKKPLDHRSPKKPRLMNEDNLLIKKSPAGEIGAAYTVCVNDHLKMFFKTFLKNKCFKKWTIGTVSNRLQGILPHGCSLKQRCVFGEQRGCVSVCLILFFKKTKAQQQLFETEPTITSGNSLSGLGIRLVQWPGEVEVLWQSNYLHPNVVTNFLLYHTLVNYRNVITETTTFLKARRHTFYE